MSRGEEGGGIGGLVFGVVLCCACGCGCWGVFGSPVIALPAAILRLTLPHGALPTLFTLPTPPCPCPCPCSFGLAFRTGTDGALVDAFDTIILTLQEDGTVSAVGPYNSYMCCVGWLW